MTQHRISTDVIKDGQILNGTNDDNHDTWIGLYDDTGNKNWSWSDGTKYDFGTDIEDFPWLHVFPLQTDENCVFLSSTTIRWDDHTCDTDQRALCTSCDAKFAKYILIQSSLSYNDAENLCQSHYGTNLASIHSQEDYQEILSIMAQFNGTIAKAWIGLNDIATESEYVYLDGTSFDYASNTSGGIYPWESDQPNNWENNEHCVQLRSNYGLLWNDVDCDGSGYAICNMPSELCNQSYWNEVVNVSAVVTWSGLNAVIKCDLEIDGGRIMMVMGGKQWANHENVVRLEYMYRVDSANGGDSGILLNYENVCNYYYIGMRCGYSLNTMVYRLFIARVEDGVYEELQSMIISYDRGVYYQLSITVTNGSNFNVSINGQYVEYNDLTNNNNNRTFSGYIGIKNTDLTITAKSLYVSGSTVYLDDNNITSEFSECPTISPTMNPTITPTIEPTSIPTAFSSSNPSVIPTFVPTNDPTSPLPSISPSSNPSEAPTKTTLTPTTNPTIEPTFNPTINPTIEPTSSQPTASQPPLVAEKDIDSKTTGTIIEDLDVMEGNTNESFFSENLIFYIIGTLVFVLIIMCICVLCIYRKITKLDRRVEKNDSVIAEMSKPKIKYGVGSNSRNMHFNEDGLPRTGILQIDTSALNVEEDEDEIIDINTPIAEMVQDQYGFARSDDDAEVLADIDVTQGDFATNVYNDPEEQESESDVNLEVAPPSMDKNNAAAISIFSMVINSGDEVAEGNLDIDQLMDHKTSINS